MENCIEIKNLNKSFKAVHRMNVVHAVNDLSLHVKSGQLFAFLGVNGAGKSTTISILCGQLRQDSGNILVYGEDTLTSMAHIRSNLGVVFQNSVLDKQLSVLDNLKLRAALYGITGSEFEKRLSELDLLLELKELYNRPVGKLSGGQRRRIDIARAIFHNPKLIILDEPTTGLDPQTRQSVWSIVERLRKEQHITVFLTTHYMEEAAGADYVVILDKGKIVAEGTPIELKNRYADDRIILYNADERKVAKLGVPYRTDGDKTEISVSDSRSATRLILQNPDLFDDYEIIKGRMDDVFLAVTGNTVSRKAGEENA